MSALTQEDIRAYYEKTWKQCDDAAVGSETILNNSSPIEDGVLYPLYQRLIGDLNIAVNGGQYLNVGADRDGGCGSSLATSSRPC